MATTFRWLLWVLVALLAVVALVSFVAYLFAARSLPQYSGKIQVAGLTGPVEIVRNNNNVPHIFATKNPDVFFGLGFAHAQDRLWQMIMLRRTAQGRLSEVFGERSLRSDDLLRRLDLYSLSVQSVQAQSPETLAALRAYSAGVNAWLAEVNKGALGRGAPELFLFSNQIAPWSPADSIAVLKLIALQGSNHLQQEVLRARTSLVLPNDRLQDILPDSPGLGIAALPDYAALWPELPNSAMASADLDAPRDPFFPVPPRGFGGASNAWAAAPKRSAAGSTLLANDPHMAFSAPGIWYLARLQLETGGVIGASIPGVPAIMLGRSEVFGWALTASYLDDQDLYIEELNPENPDQVLTPSGFQPMRSRDSIVKIKDAPDRTLTLQWTENGPVLPPYLFDLERITPVGHVTSLAWTVLTSEDRSIEAMLRLMAAKTVADGIKAAEGFVGPSQNLTLVDRDTIALKVIGTMPRRDARHRTQGRLPTRGWVPENRWQGRLDYGSNPEFIAPEGGIIGNTNNKVVERPFPLHVSHHYGDTQRILRWRFLMQNREVHTRESFVEAQLDEVSRAAAVLLSIVAKDLWFTGDPAPLGTPARVRQDALGLLAQWNGEMNEHRPEPLIYSAWMRALQHRLIRDELGPLAAEYTHVDPIFIERVFRDIQGAGAWCDILHSAPKETCTDVARLALDEALLWIDETYGGTVESLRWGDVHEATHDHPVLGNVPVLKWIVNIRQSTSGGDNTLNRGLTLGTGKTPFMNVHGAGYRGVYDFADPDSSVFIITAGQSGHPLSRHYDDLGDLWRRGEYIPMTLDPALARAGSVGVTILMPEAQ